MTSHAAAMSAPHRSHSTAAAAAAYGRLAAMSAISFVAMYALMYAMVDRWAQVYGNLSQVYMAALMTGAMVLVELACMRSMYPSARLNGLALGLGVLIMALGWFGIRQQWGSGDEQLLRAMIPHHGGAVLMCERATLRRPEVVRLCEQILRSQQQEIAWMRVQLDTAKAVP